MLIGIDVGGTYTDGVLFDGHKVINTFKWPSDSANLKQTILVVLDELLKGIKPETIERIVLSTTVVTNILATKSGERTAVVLLPGPGLPFASFRFFKDNYFLQGAIDFRGREIEGLKEPEVLQMIDQLKSEGIRKIAVVGKFSNRNPIHEQKVQKLILQYIPEAEVAIGSQIAGQLNFMRRIATTYYSVMTLSPWQHFCSEIRQALTERRLDAVVDVLKADGGTMPLTLSETRPCETIFSGPAASTMGAIALQEKKANAVIMDIGGTTTDISLLIDGAPLYASKGASIDGHYTQVHAFAVRSVALGGDSPLIYQNECLRVAPYRQEQAACFGGKQACITDVFNCLYQMEIGDMDRSRESLERMGEEAGVDRETVCAQIERMVVDQLQKVIREMFLEWENEPAYKVWEVVNGRKFSLHEIIGIGAAANTIVPILARELGVACNIHKYAPVANALGACVSRPTLAFTLHADTQNAVFSIDQEGIYGKLDNPRRFQMADARNLATSYLHQLADERGMETYASDADFYLEEQFNIIRGWDTVGKIFEVGIQVAPGLIEGFEEVSK